MRGPRTAMKSGPRSPQLEKALTQKRRPNTAKYKIINKKKLKKSLLYSNHCLEVHSEPSLTSGKGVRDVPQGAARGGLYSGEVQVAMGTWQGHLP